MDGITSEFLGHGYNEEQKPKCLPGTSLPAPVLKPIYLYEALHRSGYHYQGLSVGEFLFEALKLMRDIFIRHNVNIIPLRYEKVFDVYETWNYAKDKINNGSLEVNLQEEYIIVRLDYSEPIKLYRDGRRSVKTT